MGTIKVKFISEDQDAFKHHEFSKGAFAQSLQRKYGTTHMEKLEVPNDDFFIEIDVDKAENGIDWSKIVFPNSTIKEQIDEIIYYTGIKNKIDEILNEIKWKDFDERFELYRISEPLISIVENIKESKYFNRIQFLNKIKIVNDLKYTILQKEGRHLKYMKLKSSDISKRNAIRDFKKRIYLDLSEVNFILKNLIIDNN